jgi:hypothetical protein
VLISLTVPVSNRKFVLGTWQQPSPSQNETGTKGFGQSECRLEQTTQALVYVPDAVPNGSGTGLSRWFPKS